MSKRQDFWKKLGYTQEQINCHLEYEREKAKEMRDRKKKNNEKNKELIKQIKNDLIGKTFEFKRIKVKVLYVRPAIDGVGFWFKTKKTFSDGSEGNFKGFSHFDDYNKEEFIEYLKY